mmetsp:Transcript_16245/g.54636  ORF Transcript_16245/g.54636 Transcript_16245/m.54636 type:complete len:236 (+) Transcript_16245:283-990(+)
MQELDPAASHGAQPGPHGGADIGRQRAAGQRAQLHVGAEAPHRLPHRPQAAPAQGAGRQGVLAHPVALGDRRDDERAHALHGDPLLAVHAHPPAQDPRRRPGQGPCGVDQAGDAHQRPPADRLQPRPGGQAPAPRELLPPHRALRLPVGGHAPAGARWLHAALPRAPVHAARRLGALQHGRARAAHGGALREHHPARDGANRHVLRAHRHGAPAAGLCAARARQAHLGALLGDEA